MAEARRSLPDRCWYVFPPLLALLFVMLELQVWRGDPRVPLSFAGDVLPQMVYAQAWIDGESWNHVARLGLPGEHNLFSYPLNAHVDLVLAGVWGVLTRSAGLAVNLAWMTGVLAAAWAAGWVLRRLEVSRPVALVMAVLFALSPYAMARNVGHLVMSSYTVPLIIGYCLSLMQGSWEEQPRAARIVFWAGLVLTGLNNPYTSFFALICLAFTAVYCVVEGRRHVARQALWGLLLLAGIAMVNSIPGWVAMWHDPLAKGYVLAARTPGATVSFALRVRDMLLPIPNHPLPWMAQLTRKMDELYSDRSSENVYSALGLLASAGFVLLLVVLLSGWRGRARLHQLGRGIMPAAALTLLLLLFAIPDGLGTLLNAIVPIFRVYARASIFIAFLGLYAAGLLISAWEQRVTETGDRPWLVRGGLCGLLLLGLLDQGVLLDYPAKWNRFRGEMTELSEFCQQVSARHGDKLKVYGLLYPNYAAELNLLKPYFVTRDWSFSYAPWNAHVIEWNKQILRNEMPDILAMLKLLNFDAVWLDQDLLANSGHANYPGVLATAGLSEETDRKQRWRFYSLAQSYPPALRGWLSDAEYYRSIFKQCPMVPLRPGEALSFGMGQRGTRYLGTGWSDGPRGGTYCWSVCEVDQMAVVNLPLERINQPVEANLRASAYVLQNGPEQKVEVYSDGQYLETWTFGDGRVREQRIRLGAQQCAAGLVRLGFRTPDARSPASNGNSGDRRALGLALHELKLNPLQGAGK